jgi:hypothetical protein
MLEFKTYRNSTIDEYNKQFITYVFSELGNHNSYYTTLQLIYNNDLHFQTIPFSICTFRQLTNLSKKAFSNTKKLIIQGTIHSNHHASGVLIDAEYGNRLFTEDTYIRVKDEETNDIYHILLNPPQVSKPRPIFYLLKPGCNKPGYFIPPTFNFN